MKLHLFATPESPARTAKHVCLQYSIVTSHRKHHENLHKHFCQQVEKVLLTEHAAYFTRSDRIFGTVLTSTKLLQEHEMCYLVLVCRNWMLL